MSTNSMHVCCCVCCCVHFRCGTIKLLSGQLDVIAKEKKAHPGVKELLQLHCMLTADFAAAEHDLQHHAVSGPCAARQGLRIHGVLRACGYGCPVGIWNQLRLGAQACGTHD